MARRTARSLSLPSLLQSPEFVQLALAGVERELEETRARLVKLEAYAEHLRRGASASVASAAAKVAPEPAARRRKAAKRTRTNRLSDEARKALSERMRRRWAEYRAARETAGALVTKAPKNAKNSKK